MRYETSQQDHKPLVDRILQVINHLLIIVIAFCFNYMVVHFLFR